jgi:hypothetical protein
MVSGHECLSLLFDRKAAQKSHPACDLKTTINDPTGVAKALLAPKGPEALEEVRPPDDRPGDGTNVERIENHTHMGQLFRDGLAANDIHSAPLARPRQTSSEAHLIAPGRHPEEYMNSDTGAQQRSLAARPCLVDP